MDVIKIMTKEYLHINKIYEVRVSRISNASPVSFKFDIKSAVFSLKEVEV